MPQVAVTASELAYSRVTRTYIGTATIRNTSLSTIAGPFRIAFTSLTAGVALAATAILLWGREAIWVLLLLLVAAAVIARFVTSQRCV